MSTYHYCSDGTNVSGALTLNEISTLVARGAIKAETMISMDGGAWILAREYWPQLSAPQSPPPPPPRVDQVFLNERGVYVDTKKVVIGNQSFVTRNIGGISVDRESRSRVLPMIGFLLCGLFALCSLPQIFMGGEAQGASVFLFFAFGSITAWCASRAFSSDLHFITITASGGAIKVFPTKDAAFLSRIVEAVHRATE